MIQKILFVLFCSVLLASSTVYFQDDFSQAKWEDRWVVSDWKQDSGEAGEWGLSAGKFSAEGQNPGLQTTEDARFYAISSKFDEFSNAESDLVVQYSVKFEQSIDCGGGYVKLHPASLDQENYDGGSLYNIMFGPDVCGATKRVHLIFNYKGENYLIKATVPCETDVFTHVYTLIVKPDNTYVIKIDNKIKKEGSLAEDWDMLPAKKIPDPALSKPADWVDEKKIADPEDVKPADWDDEPAEIADPEAVKPEDWDDDLDGEWMAPTVPNPEYKGPWTPRMIDNPEYKGEWVHPEIDNPDYEYDPNLYKYESFGAVGIEVWQVKSGTIFGNFLITDSETDAEIAADKILEAQAVEKELKEADDEAKRVAAEAEHDHDHDHDEEVVFEEDRDHDEL